MRATTREKYMSVLRYMHEQNRTFSMTEVRQNAGGHSVMLSSCVKVGLVEMQSKGRYKWVGDVPTKTTANRVYNNVMKSIARKPVKQPIKRTIIRPNPRAVNLLWGLIKFNY